MSFRPLATTNDYFMEFLDRIRKVRTTVVHPDVWSRLITDNELSWLAARLPAVEFVQKRMDDIAPLTISTDGLCKIRGTAIFPLMPVDANTDNVFQIPTARGGILNDTLQMVQIEGHYYPLYLRGMAVAFRLASSPTTWVTAKPLRSDSKQHFLESSLRKPTATRIYFERKGDYIYGHPVDGDYCTELQLTYVTYPRKVWLDVTSIDDNLNFPNETDGKMPYTAGYGSVNSELEEYQKREVLDMAVKDYLERVESPRYKTNLNEFMAKASNQ